MSDLDKAIRDRLDVVRQHMTAHSAAQEDGGVDPLFNDAAELGLAIHSLLDWASALEADDTAGRYEIVRALTRQARQRIADALGVSSQDTPPAPRQWRKNDAEPPRDVLLKDGSADHLAYASEGWAWCRIEGTDYGITPWTPGQPWPNLDWDDVVGGVLTEVVSSGTDRRRGAKTLRLADLAAALGVSLQDCGTEIEPQPVTKAVTR